MGVTPLKPKIASREAYEALPNLDAVREAVADGRLDLSDGLTWEGLGAKRKTYMEFFDTSVSEQEESTAPTDTVTVSAPEAVTSKKPNKESATQPKDRASLTAMLLEQSERGGIITQTERVRNRALPNDPGEIFDWPEQDLEYKWVPYISNDRPMHPLEHARLRGMIRSGWAFYDNRYLSRGPNANGYPWHPAVDFADSKVLFDNQVLMYRSAKYEQREREAAARAKREQRERFKEEGRITDDETGHSYTVENKKGQTTVDKLLREGKNTGDGEDSFVQQRRAAEAY